MTIAQISCFLKVAECGNISRAAEEMFLSQPSLSKHIALLEEDLGLSLFERKSKGVSLTKSGEIMREFFLQSQERYKTVLLEAKQYQQEQEKTVRIGCIEGSDISFFYPKFTQILQERDVKMQLLLEGYNYSDMIQRLQSGSIDAALAISYNFRESRDIEVEPLFSIGGRIIIGRNHALAKKDRLSLSDFRGETLYSLTPSTLPQTHQNYFLEPFRRRGIDIEISYMRSVSSIFTKLQGGFGFAIVGDWIMLPYNIQECIFTEDAPLYSFDMGIAWRPKSCSGATKEFIEIITDYYGTRS